MIVQDLTTSKVSWDINEVMAKVSANDGDNDDKVYELIPAGTVVKVMTDIQTGSMCKGYVTQSQSSDSCRISFKLVVQEGKYVRRNIFFSAGVRGKSENQKEGKPDIYAEMGSESMLAMLKSARPNTEPKLDDYSQLNGLICWVKVGIKEEENGYAKQNIVKEFVQQPKVEQEVVLKDNIPF